jgi:hypothetical protein
MGVELGYINQGSVSQPMGREEFLNGPRNYDSDDIENTLMLFL